LPGEEIAERAQSLLRLYPSKRIRFVDNLCDGWAEQYADELISKDIKIHSVMEIRPKHKERFWQKLAKSGLHECQIGVEGLDSDILKRVAKGTTVLDIIYNKKSISENGIIDMGNVIAFYPHSTLDEVGHTLRLLKALLHMPKFLIVRFWLGIDSPLYQKLSKDEQEQLKISNKALRSLPEKYGDLNVFFYFETPKALGPSEEVMTEWKKIIDWYSGIKPTYWLENFLIMESDEEEGLVVYDKRNGDVIIHRPGPVCCALLRACHEGKSIDQLVASTGLSREAVTAGLRELMSQDLVLEVEGAYVGLPLKMMRSELERRHKAFLR
jgi:hypothetical protein